MVPWLHAGVGAVSIDVDFTGGSSPALVRFVVNGVALRPNGGQLLELLGQVHDLAGTATAESGDDLLIRLGHGVTVVIPARTVLHVDGGTTGTPAGPRLARPLRVRFDGDGLRLSHDSRWVARLAGIHLGCASLLPDGTVALDAQGSSRAADLALRLPLQRAAMHLTALARRSPKIRALLTR